MLPIAVEVDRTNIPMAVREEVKALVGARPVAFTIQLLRIWLVIAATIAAAEWVGTWWATGLAVVIIGIRQSMLAILTHEQVHGMAYKHRFADLLVNLFCAYPLLVLTTEGYAQVHLAHHRYYFTDKDPDHQRKSGVDWTFPKRGRDVLKLIAFDVTGVNLVKFIRGKRTTTAEFKRPGVHLAWTRPAFLVTLATVLTLTGSWGLFFWYWVLPILTVLQVIFRWGAAAEHEYNRPGAGVPETTPLIVPPWWQRILLPNLNVTLHAYHHYFPNVAFGNLPRVHEIFRKHGLVNEAAVFRGHGAYLRYLLGRSTGAQTPMGQQLTAQQLP
jgi:fatty acid desaturase